jgi:hypothetical protein
MTLNRTRIATMIGVAGTAALAAVLATKSQAQDTTQPPRPTPGFQIQPMQGPGYAPLMMMGGGTSVVADGGYLYIVQFNRILKVKESNLSIAAEKQLPRGAGGPGGAGRPGGPGDNG